MNNAAHKMRRAGVIRTTDSDQFKSDQELDDEANLKLAEANAKTESQFIREFSRSLSAEQLGVALRLLWALNVFEIAGNATQAYDGISINQCTFGSKDGIPNRVVDAGRIVDCSEKTLNSTLSAYPLHYMLCMAVMSDWPPVKVGELAQRIAKARWKERRRRQVGVTIIDQATTALLIPFRQFVKLDSSRG